MNKRLFKISVLFFLLFPFSIYSQDNEQIYNDFLKRVQDEEAYIGFFAAEEKCITTITDEYLSARRDFFIGISQCKEDPDEFGEPFIEFCVMNDLLNEGCKEEWEKDLTILSYELYANMPIFEFSTDNIIEHRNIIFAEYPNKKLELDLFIPREPMDEPMPVVVCIHGGGYVVNRRVWFEPFAKYLAANGIAAVTIDYRMLPAVEIIDCVFDSKAAVRWLRANAEKYGIDPKRIGAIGASAGAHLVTLLATSSDVPELEGNGGNPNVSSAIQAVVGIATPALTLRTGFPRAERYGLSEEEWRLLSPYENASENSAPLFLIHGTADETVPPENSQDMYDKYSELGVYVELKWIPDENHGFYEGTDIAIKMAAEFFKSQFTVNTNK
ncbi:MAG: alpha/beta hydrolase fold domain-containing protein [Ignavibacteriaceae bacterium]